MSELESSAKIIERNSGLKPLLKKIADSLAHKPDNPPPLMALCIPFSERALLMDAAERITRRFCYSRNLRVRSMKGFDLEPAFVKSSTELVACLDYPGPVLVDFSPILTDGDGEISAARLLNERQHQFTLLICEQDPDTLLIDKKISAGLRAEIKHIFIWPDASQRSASMKRDYFLRHVLGKNSRAGEALDSNSEARLLLQQIFSLPGRGTSIDEILKCANAYLSHLDDFEATKHPVEVLAHFATFVLDEARVTTPPAQDEGANAA